MNVQRQRRRMVTDQLIARGIADARVLAAMRTVPRHEFVPADQREMAYADMPVPIGSGQTISQPYIVARMSELLALEPGQKVLEIGTGCGYQTAVLAQITPEVYSVEVVRALCDPARARLKAYGVDPEHVVLGDGYRGLPQFAPYDAILVTAAPQRIPGALLDQLKPGGRLVIPVGPRYDVQDLLVITKMPDGSVRRRVEAPVRFVPMVRTAEDRPN